MAATPYKKRTSKAMAIDLANKALAIYAEIDDTELTMIAAEDILSTIEDQCDDNIYLTTSGDGILIFWDDTAINN